MVDVARFYLIAFGVFTILGGVVGYVKAKSVDSVLAGSIFGALLIGAGALVSRGASWGLWVGFAVSAMLAGRFSTAFRRSHKVMPAGVMALLGLAGIAITLLALAR